MDSTLKSGIGNGETSVKRSKPVVISKIDNCTFADEWYEIASDDHFWIQWRFSIFKKFLKKLNVNARERLNVLEIGCGNGAFLRQIEQNTDWKTVGVDMNMEALNNSMAKRSQLFFYDITEKNSMFNQVYDIVILMDVLEHIEEPCEFLESCFSCLRSGGILIVNVPALQSMYSVYDRVMGHLRRYDNRTLLKELAVIDGRNIITVYWGITLLPVLFLRKLLISKNRTHENIVERGFMPMGRLSRVLLVFLMRLELLFFKKPLIGTSLMGAISKK